MYRLARMGFGAPGLLDVAEALFYIRSWVRDSETMRDIYNEK